MLFTITTNKNRILPICGMTDSYLRDNVDVAIVVHQLADLTEEFMQNVIE